MNYQASYIKNYVIKDGPRRGDRKHNIETELFKEEFEAISWLNEKKNENVPDLISDIDFMKKLHRKGRRQCRVAEGDNWTGTSHWFIIEFENESPNS